MLLFFCCCHIATARQTSQSEEYWFINFWDIKALWELYPRSIGSFRLDLKETLRKFTRVTLSIFWKRVNLVKKWSAPCTVFLRAYLLRLALLLCIKASGAVDYAWKLFTACIFSIFSEASSSISVYELKWNGLCTGFSTLLWKKRLGVAVWLNNVQLQ